MQYNIVRLGRGDEAALQQVAPCFDGPIDPVAAARFLDSDLHHLLVAYDNGSVAGFISGVEMTHPDKGTEMFIYELAVLEKYRRQGYGTQLVNALEQIARDRKCYGMWVLADADNAAALSTYAAAGGARESVPVMVSWALQGKRNGA
jgi:ribosomal protein S18 acetylase RimI-like enzyme